MSSHRNLSSPPQPVQYYQALKPKLAHFSSIISRPRLSTIQKSVPPNPYQKRISQLQKAQKNLTQQIKVLKQENQILLSKLSSYTEITKKLIQQRLLPNEMHYIVQELIMSDAKLRISDAQNQLRSFRQQIQRQKLKTETAQQSNKQLQGVLKRYRKLINTSLKPSSKKTNQSFLQSLPSIKKNFYQAQHKKLTEEQLLQYLQNLSKDSEIDQILSLTQNFIKVILDCQQCTIFIPGQQILREFMERCKIPHRVIIQTGWLYVFTHPLTDLGDPLFSKISEIGKGILKSSYILSPVELDKDLALIIQCRFPNKSQFSTKDQTNLNTILAGALLATKQNISNRKILSLEKKIKKISNLMVGFSRCKTHQDFSNTVDSFMPTFTGFQGASVAFVDGDDFYVNVLSSVANQKYQREVVKFPNTLGLCGRALQFQQILKYDNMASNSLYYPQLDNRSGLKNLNSLLLACLPGNKGNVGVLLLGNKVEGKISENDVEMVDDIRVVLGCFVEGINNSAQALELTAKMKNLIQSIVNLSKEKIEGMDVSDLGDTLELLKVRLGVWCQEKGI